MENTFKTGDKVIWNSGWGYDFGIYQRPSESWEGTHVVEMTSGVVRGENSFFLYQLLPDTEANRILMKEKYGEHNTTL